MVYAALGIVAFAAGRGSAQPAGLELRWSAPASCPAQRDVLEQVSRLLGGARVAAAGVRVSASVREQAGVWRAELETRRAESVSARTIEAESCVALADATALFVALLLDPEAAPERDAAPRESVPTRTAQPLPAQSVRTEPASRPLSSRARNATSMRIVSRS